MRLPSSLLVAPLLALSLSACSSSGSSGGAGGDTEPPDMAGMLEAHNAARAAVMPAASPAIPPLTWSGTVADAAQSWASQCNFSHDAGMYGQNIYASTADSTPDQVVAAWVAEVANYDYATNSCSMVCGHYTQVVWRDSTELGCGVQSCTTGSPFGSGSWQIYVCNYSPPGNFVGQKPY
jgi:pathogenesis-related protein 1